MTRTGTGRQSPGTRRSPVATWAGTARPSRVVAGGRMMSRPPGPSSTEAAVTSIDRVARPPVAVDDEELQHPWSRVRRFLTAVLATIWFGATPAGEPVRAA